MNRCVPALAIACAVLLAGCASSSSTPEPVITLSPHDVRDAPAVSPDVQLSLVSTPRLGSFLVGNGRTLYMYPPDHRRAVTCTNARSCDQAWPPLLVNPSTKVVAGHGVSKALIGTDKGDGGRVVTYNGWPLYYYIGDQNPGDINGQGQGFDWYVIGPDGKPIHTSLKH